MRRICYGGSFNPIHFGHLRCAKAVAEGRYEKVVLIPSRQPPHKPGMTDLAPVEHRLMMCRLAIADNPLFEVCDIELRRTGPSYTFDTAEQLKQNGWSEIHWLIGADMLMSLPKWHRAEELVQQVHFVVMARPGWTMEWTALPTPFRHLHGHVVAAPEIDISSTQIRASLNMHGKVDQLLPPPVLRYIHEHSLYLSPTR